MSHRIKFVFLFSLCLTVSSCICSNVSSQLATADQLMMDCPDSSLTIINNISQVKMHGKRIKARYSLLHTMAIHRSGVDATDRNLIVDAVNYFSRTGSYLDRARTFFYSGILYFNCGDYNSALMDFLRAKSHADKTDNLWLKGMISELIGMTYNEGHNFEEELSYKKEAYNYFLAYGDQKYIDYATHFLATGYHNLKEFAKSDSLLVQIKPESSQYPYAMQLMAFNEIYKPSPDYALAVDYYKQAHALGSLYSADLLYQYAYALIMVGDIHSCNSIIDSLEGSADDAKTYWWKYKIALEKGDVEQCQLYLSNYARETERYAVTKLSQPLMKVTSDYYAEVANHSALKQKRDRTILLITLISATILALIWIIVSQRKVLAILTEKKDIESKYNSAQRLLSDIKEEKIKTETKISQAWASYVSMYQQHMASIGKLYKRNRLYISVPEEMESYISEILSELSGTDYEKKRFESRLNKDLDDIITKIKRDFPGLNERNIRLITFMVAGFDNLTISQIMNESKSAISTRKSRLRKQIIESQSKSAELYRLVLS